MGKSEIEKALLRYGMPKGSPRFSGAARVLSELSEKYDLGADEVLAALEKNPRESAHQYNLQNEMMDAQHEIAANEKALEKCVKEVEALEKKTEWVRTAPASGGETLVDKLGSAGDGFVRNAIIIHYQAKISGLIEQIEKLEKRNAELAETEGRVAKMHGIARDFESMLKNHGILGKEDREGAELIKKHVRY